MIYLSKGILNKILERQLYFKPVIEIDQYTGSSQIRTLNEAPIIVRIDSIDVFKKHNKVGLKLDDGETIVGCILDNKNWNNLNSDKYHTCFGKYKPIINPEQTLNIGTVIIICDYTFSDLNIYDEVVKDVLTILNLFIVGLDENYK